VSATAADPAAASPGGFAGPRPPSHPDGLADAIARLRRALRRGARVADPSNPLAVAQLELLSALVENPGSRPGQLAQLLHMRPNTVTTIVNALAAHGMVSRVGSDYDRRAIELTATSAGQEAVRVWQATNARVLQVALATLSAQQRRVLAAALPALDALGRAVDRLADEPQPAGDPPSASVVTPAQAPGLGNPLLARPQATG
jgi:DNA-binding MarR family transcriptional regulator